MAQSLEKDKLVTRLQHVHGKPEVYAPDSIFQYFLLALRRPLYIQVHVKNYPVIS